MLKYAGSGSSGELTAIDIISLLSFAIGLENLEMNISQTDLQEETQKLNDAVDKKVQLALTEIHTHLEQQDAKIDLILKKIGDKNDS